MTIRKSRLAATLAASAAFSLVATPAMAQGWGWGGGWGPRHHRDRIDAGDVLTGILIIGGIAAIASAASSGDRHRNDRRDREDYPPPPPPPQQSNGYAGQSGPSWGQGGIGNAVDRCMQEVTAGNGRDTIDQVSRAGEGWRVQGRNGDGKGFTCVVDGQGRIRNISVEGESY